LKSGKKSLAQKIVYEALDIIEKDSFRSRLAGSSADNEAPVHETPIPVLEKAVKNVTPQVEVKARRVGGSTYQVPIEIRAYRGTNISLKWITESAREGTSKTMAQRLANEISQAAEGRGNSIRKKEQVHKMADANKAFAHFKY